MDLEIPSMLVNQNEMKGYKVGAFLNDTLRFFLFPQLPAMISQPLLRSISELARYSRDSIHCRVIVSTAIMLFLI